MATHASTLPLAQSQPSGPRLPAPVGTFSRFHPPAESDPDNRFHLSPSAIAQINRVRHSLEAIGQGQSSEFLTARESLDQVILDLLNLAEPCDFGSDRASWPIWNIAHPGMSAMARARDHIGSSLWAELLDVRRALFDFMALFDSFEDPARRSFATRIALRLAAILDAHFREREA